MQIVRVGVLRGGTNPKDFKKSMSDGAIVLRALREHDNYDAVDVLIDKDEVWYIDGVPVKPSKLIQTVDVCISTIEKPLAIHGNVESIVRSLGVPCIHTPKIALRGYIPDSLAQKIESIGVKSLRRMELDEFSNDVMRNVHQTFSPPYSISFVNGLGEVKHLFHASNMDDLIDVFTYHKKTEPGKYVIEEYVHGDEWAVTVVPDFRDTKYYILHPVYIGSVNPAFRSNLPMHSSVKENFASPQIREALDLYAQLTAGALKSKLPTTFIFRHNLGKKPILTRAMERYILNNDETIQKALRENAISESEFLELLINRSK